MDKEILKKAYKYLCYIGEISSQDELASKMNYDARTVSEAMNGKARSLTARFLKQFNKAFDNIFRQEWLLTGEGEMLVDATQQPKTIPMNKEQRNEEEQLRRDSESRLWELIHDFQMNNRRLMDENDKLKVEIDHLRSILDEKRKGAV